MLYTHLAFFHHFQNLFTNPDNFLYFFPQWTEESFTNFQKNINWRSYVVCDVHHSNVNNWLWSPPIDRGNANRLYIEIHFTIRDCMLFPGKKNNELKKFLYRTIKRPIEFITFQLFTLQWGNVATWFISDVLFIF